MFTGIVEHVGKVTAVEAGADLTRLRIDSGPLDDVEVGHSVSVNGVCLTAVSTGPAALEVEVVPETLSRTSLGALSEGSPVNLERAMAASGRFDGHIVQGHVDGVGTVSGVTADDDGSRMTIELPDDLVRYVVEKGSITVDGVSLTVAAVKGASFQVALIPHTLAMTTLGLRKEGDLVNLEADVLAKYVERLMQAP